MHQLTLHSSITRAIQPVWEGFKPVSYPSRRDRILLTAMWWIVAADAIILSSLFVKLFYLSPTTLYAADIQTSREPGAVGPATGTLMQQLKADGFTPVASVAVDRRPFSVTGRTIALGTDSIQVFEYTDPTTAQNEAAAFSAKQDKSARPPAWKKRIHMYTNGDLAIFYMGDEGPITAALEVGATRFH